MRVHIESSGFRLITENGQIVEGLKLESTWESFAKLSTKSGDVVFITFQWESGVERLIESIKSTNISSKIGGDIVLASPNIMAKL